METKRPRPHALEARKKCKYYFFHWRRFRNDEVWCKCDTHRLSRGWTSDHPGINKFIKETQRCTRDWMDPYLEWIPYENLNNIQKIGEGGFSVVYSAEWGDIEKRISWPSKNRSLPVAIKRLKGSQEMSESFIEELRTHHRCISTPPATNDNIKYDHGFLRFFGITQDPETKDYAMVTELASLRDIRHVLDQMFYEISWSDKLYWLRNISSNLVTIHENGYTHRNLHPGNILIGQIKDGTMRPEARNLLKLFDHWWDRTQDSEMLDDEFSQADKYIPEQKREYENHPGAVYVSREINFEVLSTGNTEKEINFKN
ncbi:3889_t:CDS:2 [Acaulospora morrowiae]|uniref:3889_t:CDS:1 n=1 Tax=Acaulospora morrowiae TaxID=94023 RepID=A0A9N9C4K1_9GLOM|nr:3889_t:CDS:2 [Acaulospora morrowiae]